jgi:hypothetical protein
MPKLPKIVVSLRSIFLIGGRGNALSLDLDDLILSNSRLSRLKYSGVQALSNN